MRISVRKDDPGYTPEAFKYQAYLDGVLITKCFTADEEEGKLWRSKTGSNGNVILNDDKTAILIV